MTPHIGVFVRRGFTSRFKNVGLEQPATHQNSNISLCIGVMGYSYTLHYTHTHLEPLDSSEWVQLCTAQGATPTVLVPSHGPLLLNRLNGVLVFESDAVESCRSAGGQFKFELASSTCS